MRKASVCVRMCRFALTPSPALPNYAHKQTYYSQLLVPMASFLGHRVDPLQPLSRSRPAANLGPPIQLQGGLESCSCDLRVVGIRGWHPCRGRSSYLPAPHWLRSQNKTSPARQQHQLQSVWRTLKTLFRSSCWAGGPSWLEQGASEHYKESLIYYN